jgi:L-aminopeptidase/D-esterase-like protein
MGRMGAIGSNGSGDIFIAFSTANPPYQVWSQDSNLASLTVLDDYATTPISEATVQATEEAIINAMLAAETMSGANHLTAPAIPHSRLREVMRKYNRLEDSGLREAR